MFLLQSSRLCFTHLNIPIIRNWLFCVSVKLPRHLFFSQWSIVLFTNLTRLKHHFIIEPHHEKTGLLPIYTKTKAEIICAVTAQLISIFVFSTLIVQFLFFLDPKLQASNHVLYLYWPVCVGPGPKHRRSVHVLS